MKLGFKALHIYRSSCRDKVGALKKVYKGITHVECLDILKAAEELDKEVNRLLDDNALREILCRHERKRNKPLKDDLKRRMKGYCEETYEDALSYS